MRTIVKWLIPLVWLYAPLSLAQSVAWEEPPVFSIRMLPDRPDSNTPVGFELVKTCDPLWLGAVERTGSEVRVELWISDYCANFDPPRTHTKVLGIMPPGNYTVSFYTCEDLPSPLPSECYFSATRSFSIAKALIRPIPFVALGTLLILPLLLLFVAARVVPRR